MKACPAAMARRTAAGVPTPATALTPRGLAFLFHETPPRQQRRDHPKRDRSPAPAPPIPLPQSRDGLRCERHARAGREVDLLGDAQSAMQQPWDARQQMAGFAYPSGRAFELPGRTEMARDPFPHDRLGGGPDVKPGI